MKIVISSEGQDLSSRVDARFGRAKWFILFDTETELFESFSNQQVLNLPQGAGIQAAGNVLDRKPDVVLTGHCGPKAFRTLKAGGAVVFVGVGGTVNEAIERYRKGEFKPADNPDVEGHW